MCHSPHSDGRPGRRAIALADGHAHDHDHAAWTRRDFLAGLGLGVAGATLSVAGVPGRALAGSPLLPLLGRLETDRVLVLVQLAGGNDGLNTVVPVGNDLYHAARPTLALGAADTLPLAADLRLHGALAAVAPEWEAGRLAVVQSVGYSGQDLSHFRSTDIWLTASGADEVLGTGWGGRALATLYPDFEAEPPAAPPAVQVGTSAPLLFQGPTASYAMAMFDVDTFLDIVEGGTPYDPADVPPTAAGGELAFLRTVANDAFRYRAAVQAAADAAPAGPGYPDDEFAQTLRAVARLIRGGLDTRVFLVSLSGFDTHATQAAEHAALLAQLGGALAAFFADLAAAGHAERTLALTFSEFGRRVEENGSAGTDHGAAAPLFLAGPAVRGGLFGEAPDLADLDDEGNVRHAVDFRQVYASVLTQWLGLDAATTAAVLGGTFAPLDLITQPVGTAAPLPAPLALAAPAPNPTRETARVSFSVPTAGPVRLDAFDARGRLVAVLADGPHPAGAHTVTFDARRLPAGAYTLRLTAAGAQAVQRATVVR